VPNKLLSEALLELHELQKQGNIFRTEDFSGKNLTYLKKAGYLQSIIRGWYHQSYPAQNDGDTTTWYAGYWEFVSKYLENRFNGEYSLNPEASLFLHTKSSIIPKQVVVITKKGALGKVELVHGTSLFIYPEKKSFPHAVTILNGLNIMSLEESLCKVGKLFYQKNQNEVEIALSMIQDVSSILHILLNRERMDDASSRIAGALKFVGRESDAKRIKESYETATFKQVSLVNPFLTSEPILSPSRERNPYALRLQAMWKQYRLKVMEVLEEYDLVKQERQTLLAQMDEKYQADAYHSLSIEGYKVTLNLIDKVSNGEWNPEKNNQDNETRNALAAKGYYLVFEAVKETIANIITEKKSMSHSLSIEHHVWYQKLFEPSIVSGLLEAHHLAGYRNHQVYLQGSKHVPFPKEAIVDAMEVYFELLEEEENPLVQAILGHHMFGFIHPYMDGNGRMARFIMNALLVSAGYSWVIIKVEDRHEYMQCLEEASVDGEIDRFARFVLDEIKKSLTD